MANNHDPHPPRNQLPSSQPKTDPIPVMTPDREKMSRALGAAFLQHQVQQLERNLDDMSFRRDLNHHPQHASSTRPKGSQATQAQVKKHSTKRPHDPNPASSSTGHGSVAGSHPATSSSSQARSLAIKVIDTSMLIHALPVLKKWTRERKYKIVIPLDVISELDFLKTSPPPIHGLVKEATCWLDTQFQQTMGHVDQHARRFVPQRTGDECTWELLSQRFSAPAIDEASVAAATDEGAEAAQALASTDLPRQLRSLFQCALWQQSHAGVRQESSLVVFQPAEPAHLPPARRAHPPPAGSQGPSAGPDAGPSTSVADWAPRFGIQIQLLGPAELADAKRWLRAEAERRKHPSPTHRQTPSNGIPASSSRQTPGKTTSVDKRLFVW